MEKADAEVKVEHEEYRLMSQRLNNAEWREWLAENHINPSRYIIERTDQYFIVRNY